MYFHELNLLPRSFTIVNEPLAVQNASQVWLIGKELDERWDISWYDTHT